MTTYGQYFGIPGLVATATLAAKQYHIVKFASTAGEVVIASAATDKIAGVVQNDPIAGQEADVAVLGIAKVVAAASVAAGDHITTNTTGRAATTTTGNNHVLGIALDASSANGDVIRVALAISNY